MEQKTKTLENNTYFTKIVESTEIDGAQVQNTIYPLSLQGVKELTKNIAESELVDVEYLTVNSFTDYTREQLKDKKYIQLTNTAELEDIFKVKKGEPVKPKFIFCFLNKTKEETGKKAEKKREKESKTEENIPEHHFLPIILFNGKKYIFDLDLRNIEDSEFVKNINDDNTFIFNVKPNNTDKKYTRGQLIQADEYNCGTNTVEVAQQIYEHYIKYFHYEKYKAQYCKKHNIKSNDYKAEKLFENYLQKEIKLDGKFVLLSQSSGTINKYLQKLHENIKNQPDTEQEKWMKYVKKLRQINILCGTLETEKEELFGKLSSEETESGKQAEKQIGKLKEQQQKEAQETKQSLQKEINELKQQHKKYFSIINLKTLQTNTSKGILSALKNVYSINCGKCENITPLQTIHNIRNKHETLLKNGSQAKNFILFKNKY